MGTSISKSTLVQLLHCSFWGCSTSHALQYPRVSSWFSSAVWYWTGEGGETLTFNVYGCFLPHFQLQAERFWLWLSFQVQEKEIPSGFSWMDKPRQQIFPFSFQPHPGSDPLVRHERKRQNMSAPHTLLKHPFDPHVPKHMADLSFILLCHAFLHY